MISLPSLSQLDRGVPRIWLAIAPADMRCGFDRLAEMARTVVGQDPSGGHLFVFRSRGGDRLKILYWDRDGFALWYKRFEAGTFRLSRADDAALIELRVTGLAMLLDGLDLRSLRRLKRVSRSSS